MVCGAHSWEKRRGSLAFELGNVALLGGHVLSLVVALSHLDFISLLQLPRLLSLSLFRCLGGAYAKVLLLADTLSVRLGRLL